MSDPKNPDDLPEDDFEVDGTTGVLSLNSSNISGTQTLGAFIGTNDGFIVRYYDQSGNARNATQSTASFQDKIISAGTILTKNGKPISNNVLGSSYTISGTLNGTSTAFFVGENAGTDEYILMQGDSAGNKAFGVAQNGSTSSTFADVTSVTQGGNGSIVAYNRDTLFDAMNATQLLYYFKGDFNNWTDLFLGYPAAPLAFETYNLQELVIYNSDKSARKTEIEANQNDFYSIYP